MRWQLLTLLLVLTHTALLLLLLLQLTCREAMKQVAKMLHVLHDEAKDKPFEIEMSWICEETGYKHAMVDTKLVQEAETWAKESIESDEMED